MRVSAAACRSQETALDPLELEVQVVVICPVRVLQT